MFETISALRGRSRIFMVGIGSAPNTFLMTRAAELGRGAFTHIGSTEQVEERMRGLFAKLENPAVTWPDRQVLRRQVRHDAGGSARRLSRRAAGARPPGSTSSPAPSRSRAASATGRGASPCRWRMPPRARASRNCGPAARLPMPKFPHHAAGDARGSRQGRSRAGAGASTRDAAHQPRCGRQDTEPARWRDAQAG